VGFNPFSNTLSGAFPSSSGSFQGNTSSQVPTFGHSIFRPGFQPASNTGGGVNFWNPGPNVASNFLGQAHNSGFQNNASNSNSLAQTRLPFLATLNLPDLSKLTNDPVYHVPGWPPVPTKLPSDIPKFEAKAGEDPADHITTFHLWCSSNSLMDDSIRLRLFQRTLTGVAAKWYIELPGNSFVNFERLAITFLNHFQLPVRYETGTELLTSFRQNTSTHISDHIHEWRRRRRMIKAEIPGQFLVDWFVKSLLPYIAKDVALSGVTTEEEAIIRAQQLDLVYSQSRVLYDILPNAPRTETDPTKFVPGPHADGVVGSAQNTAAQQNVSHSQQQANPCYQNANTSADILSIQKGSQPSEGKKKGKNKKKNGNNPGNNNNNTSNNNNQNPTAGKDKKKGKVRYPCKLCGESHFLSECPQLAEAKKLYDQNRAGQPAVLTQPFPANQQMVVGTQNPGGNQGNNQGNDSSTAHIYMCQTEVDLQTRAKSYDTPVTGSHDKEATTSQSAPLHIERPPVGMMPHIPKSVLKKSAHNPNARAAQNYSIVEDLAQAPCAMSALEVLQTCPAQRRALLSAIGAF